MMIKKMMVKKLFALLLVCIVVLGLLPVSVLAAEAPSMDAIPFVIRAGGLPMTMKDGGTDICSDGIPVRVVNVAIPTGYTKVTVALKNDDALTAAVLNVQKRSGTTHTAGGTVKINATCTLDISDCEGLCIRYDDACYHVKIGYPEEILYAQVTPAVGPGYTTTGATYVKKGEDYSFSVHVKNAYDSTNMVVKVNGVVVTPSADGVYTVRNVSEDLVITIHDVKEIPSDGDVTFYFSVEQNRKFVEEGGVVWAMREVTVPYFDLEAYGLSHLYYNPYCYAGDSQNPGTSESAQGHVTALHAFIWLTEVYWHDVDAEEAGQGLLAKEFKWDGFSLRDGARAGSAFFNMWNFGGDFNYYLNYEYPLGSPSWGSTCDQIKLCDGDVMSIRYNDNSGNVGTYWHFGKDPVIAKTVTQGEDLELELYRTGEDYFNYTTPIFLSGSGNKIYLIPAHALQVDPTCGTHIATTGSDGKFNVDTAEITPGTYYLASGTASPAVLMLTVEPTAENPEPSVIFGDVDGDGSITGNDALKVQRFVVELESEINEAAADVDGLAGITGNDALMIQRRVVDLITQFPVEAA